jgi:putative ABC transport system permease protein
VRLPPRIRRFFRLGTIRSDVRRDLDDELGFHFSEAVGDLMERGLTEQEAHREARLRFGDERAYRHALERIDDGRMRMRYRSDIVHSCAGTLAHAFRSVRRAPGFTASIVGILALGLGANAVMFGVVDRLLLSPPQHVVDADDVHLLYVRREIFNGETRVGQTVTYPDYLDFHEVDAFANVAGYSGVNEVIVGRGEAARQARVVGASARLFPLLGVRPALGRFFDERDETLEAQPTAVLSYEYWEREHGRNPEMVGQTLDVGEDSYTVIGVAPPGFTGAELSPVDIWLPAIVRQVRVDGIGCLESRGCYWWHTVARLAPEATTEAAAAEATAAHRAGRGQLIAEGRYDANAEVVVAPIIAARGPSPTREARVAGWLAGVSLIVLLIACFNVANLLLARSIRTRRESAVRLALGVGRGRLISEIIAQSLVLSLLGAAAALLVAQVLDDAVHQVLLPNVAFRDARLGARLLGFTLLVTLATGVLAGAIPAVQATKARLADALRAGGRGIAGGHSKTRAGLLVGQAALSVILLIGAGLFVRSLHEAESLDLGFDADRIAVVVLEWNESLDAAVRREIYDRALEGIRRLPGVHHAGLTYTVNFRNSISIGRPRVPGLDSIPTHRNGGPYVNKVGSGYFEAMGLTVLQGRGFGPSDDAEDAPPVALVSESMARAIWPDGDAVGACMMLGNDPGAPCTEVVGVVENHRRQSLVEDDPHFLYFVNQAHPEFQGPPQALVAGTSGEASRLLELLRDEAATASTQIRFVNANTMRDFVEPQMRSWILGASMFTAFGFLALIVAGWGLYSVLAFDVALRQHELGIRSALGAGGDRLVRLVLRQAGGLVGAGITIGLLTAYVAARFVEPLLFKVSATDPRVYALVAAALGLVALVAGTLPAWRATRVDPREALQAD